MRCTTIGALVCKEVQYRTTPVRFSAWVVLTRGHLSPGIFFDQARFRDIFLFAGIYDVARGNGNQFKFLKTEDLNVEHEFLYPRISPICQLYTRSAGSTKLSNVFVAITIAARSCALLDGDMRIELAHFPACFAPFAKFLRSLSIEHPFTGFSHSTPQDRGCCH